MGDVTLRAPSPYAHCGGDLLDSQVVVQFEVATSLRVHTLVDLDAQDEVELVVESDPEEMVSQRLPPPVSQHTTACQADEIVHVIAADNPPVLWVVENEEATFGGNLLETELQHEFSVLSLVSSSRLRQSI